MISAVIDHLRRTPWFFWLIIASACVVQLAHAWAPNKAVFKGQSPAILVGLAVAMLVIAAWLPYRSSDRWGRPGRIVLILGLLLWLWDFASTALRRDGYNYLVFCVPLFLALLLWRRPRWTSGNEPLLILGYGIAAIALVDYVLGAAHLMPSGFDVGDGGTPTKYEWLASLIGAETRWGGPFSSVNLASAAGGLAAIIGLSSRGVHSWVLGFAGVFIMLLGQGDAATLAFGVSALIYLLWSARASQTAMVRRARLPLLVVLILMGAVLSAVRDGAFDQRLLVWRNFFGLWLENPAFGVGIEGVAALIRANERVVGFTPYTHAHSVLLNGLVYRGLPWGVLMVAILAVTAWLCYRALPILGSGALAVAIYVVFVGAADTVYGWLDWSLYAAALVVLVSMADDAQRLNAVRIAEASGASIDSRESA